MAEPYILHSRHPILLHRYLENISPLGRYLCNIPGQPVIWPSPVLQHFTPRVLLGHVAPPFASLPHFPHLSALAQFYQILSPCNSLSTLSLTLYHHIPRPFFYYYPSHQHAGVTSDVLLLPVGGASPFPHRLHTFPHHQHRIHKYFPPFVNLSSGTRPNRVGATSSQ